MSDVFIIPPEPSKRDYAAAVICGHKVVQSLDEEASDQSHGFVQQVLETTVCEELRSIKKQVSAFLDYLEDGDEEGLIAHAETFQKLRELSK